MALLAKNREWKHADDEVLTFVGESDENQETTYIDTRIHYDKFESATFEDDDFLRSQFSWAELKQSIRRESRLSSLYSRFLTANNISDESNIFNSVPENVCKPEIVTSIDLNQSSNNKKYLDAKQSIENQYEEFEEFFGELPKSDVLSISLGVLNKILTYNPKVITSELTYEKSILFTFLIHEFTYFLQYYFELEYDSDDEAILSLYKGDDKMPSHAGSLENILTAITVNINHNESSYGGAGYYRIPY
jgi:hypothetical protein